MVGKWPAQCCLEAGGWTPWPLATPLSLAIEEEASWEVWALPGDPDAYWVMSPISCGGKLPAGVGRRGWGMGSAASPSAPTNPATLGGLPIWNASRSAFPHPPTPVPGEPAAWEDREGGPGTGR